MITEAITEQALPVVAELVETMTEKTMIVQIILLVTAHLGLALLHHVT